ncbi:hypothetical protein [Myroides marinus]|uniref:hypothetical protein n=1 Tax=Myroides marinus TaxID=703342 RepID=UPI0025761C4E|nr:hypothetical protein [Myroides marinus]MDM1377857.1 hypothetical protein [Myroides marinus]MDM1384939.1 hypothetical protein [Myroides marinus]MDM1392341.1 hypothetical protein [Myroides marinus]
MKRKSLFAVMVLATGLTMNSCKNTEVEEKSTEGERNTNSVNFQPEEIVFTNLGTDDDGFEHFSLVSGTENIKDYPRNFSFSNTMITPGAFHTEEVPETIESKEWLGLISDKDNTYKLVPIKPIVSKLFDTEHSESEVVSGVEITQKDQQNCILYIEKQNNLKETNVEVANIPSYIYPGEKVSFAFKGKEYTLYATGTRKLNGVNEADFLNSVENGYDMPKYYVKNYTLRMEIKDGDKINEVMLLSQRYFEEGQVPKVIFGGDINNDNIVDILINTSTEYNVSRPTLYLSDTTNNNVSIQPVAAHESIGC